MFTFRRRIVRSIGVDIGADLPNLTIDLVDPAGDMERCLNHPQTVLTFRDHGFSQAEANTFRFLRPGCLVGSQVSIVSKGWQIRVRDQDGLEWYLPGCYMNFGEASEVAKLRMSERPHCTCWPEPL